ncbi:hypothetical protein JCGZ_14797 [Jatropha curcas]|uniref:Uncharacterized protein n=1 Tax=Jatropha curcas TaxID=180498 RepID=A0A067K609_JATCU|nr:hypothetical protein JCGZ_14797 [Jatropha curcas]
MAAVLDAEQRMKPQTYLKKDVMAAVLVAEQMTKPQTYLTKDEGSTLLVQGHDLHANHYGTRQNQTLCL